MPMVGTATASVTRRATTSGTPSSTMAKHAGLDERLGVVDQGAGGVELLALHLEAAHGVHRLRREADVAHHRDLGVDDGLDHRHPLAPPSSFTAPAPARTSAAALRTVSSTDTW